jgi:biopolymer transport protein ExbB/TolQ
MEKDSKKHADACENRSYFIMKIILLILSLIVVVQFAVVAKCFVSLKALNGRLNSLELNNNSLRPCDKVEEHDPRRSKRSIDQATFKHAMFQLRKMEER